MKKKLTALILAMMMILLCAGNALATERFLQKGDTGDEVRQVQDRLIALKYPLSILSLEYLGRSFGADTEKCVTLFQNRNGLLASGIVDDMTWDALFGDDAEVWVDNSWNALYDVAEEDGYLSWNGIAAYATGMPVMMAEIPWNTEEYTQFAENGFRSVAAAPLSTFAADVDTSAYSRVRSRILKGLSVSPDSVRVEEMLNYFRYDYAGPRGDEPFGVTMEMARCPWNEKTLLLQIGLQARVISREDRPAHNLVFLIDTSGSMEGADRLDLVKRAYLLMLEELNPTDTVSIVAYASQDRVVLEGMPVRNTAAIMEAISDLEAGGSTNGSAGLIRAYELAEKYYVEGGVNRIILATDGDLNVGVTSTGDLARLVTEKKKAGVGLTVMGFGYGNLKDNKLEALADYGDGNCWYIDTIHEARKALVTEADGTFITVAKDVKLQLDFNPAKVSGYRLIGYEDRLLAPEDFHDDTRDGGEIGSGHRVTALYEIVPAGSDFDFGAAQSRYAPAPSPEDEDGEWLTLSVRAKKPDSDVSDLYTYPLTGEPAGALSDNMTLAAAIAETAMLLRDSPYKGSSTYESALELLRSNSSVVGDPCKEEFLYLVGLLAR